MRELEKEKKRDTLRNVIESIKFWFNTNKPTGRGHTPVSVGVAIQQFAHDTLGVKRLAMDELQAEAEDQLAKVEFEIGVAKMARKAEEMLRQQYRTKLYTSPPIIHKPLPVPPPSRFPSPPPLSFPFVTPKPLTRREVLEGMKDDDLRKIFDDYRKKEIRESRIDYILEREGK